MNTDRMVAELNHLELEKERCLKKFYSRRNLMSHDTSFKSIMLEIMQLCCSIQRKTIELIKRYEEDVETINSEIAHLQSVKKQREGGTRVTNRKKKKKQFFFDNESLSRDNVAESLYFHVKSDRCRHENGDLLDIHAMGYKFASRLRIPRRWHKDDRNRLFNAVLVQMKHLNLKKLTELYRELQSTDEEKIIRSLLQEASGLTEHLDSDSVNRDLLRAVINTNEINWNYISEKCFKNRRDPQELQSIWTLVVSPTNIHVKKWTLEEDILLRCLAVDNNYQNWDRINELMPTSRSGFFCFSRFSFIHKQKHSTTTRKTRKADGDICSKTKKRGAFSKREKFVVYNYLKRGYSYKSIANMLQNRSEKQIREHYYASIRRRNCQLWTKPEDDRLLSGVKFLGKGNWRVISRYMNRTPDQCRMRFKYLMMHKRKHCEAHLDRKFSTTSILLARIKKFISKENMETQINKKVESYFLMKLVREKPKIRKCDTLTKHAFKLLNFLNLEVSCTTQYDEFNKWLAKYPSSNEDEKLDWDIFFLAEFAKLREIREKLPMKMVNNIFSNVVNRSSKVLPPNMTTIEGLNKFMENYKVYFEENNNVDFKVMWKQQNTKYLRKKYFNESKILWYYVLKAIFFWPLKLKSFSPTNLS